MSRFPSRDGNWLLLFGPVANVDCGRPTASVTNLGSARLRGRLSETVYTKHVRKPMHTTLRTLISAATAVAAAAGSVISSGATADALPTGDALTCPSGSNPNAACFYHQANFTDDFFIFRPGTGYAHKSGIYGARNRTSYDLCLSDPADRSWEDIKPGQEGSGHWLLLWHIHYLDAVLPHRWLCRVTAEAWDFVVAASEAPTLRSTRAGTRSI